MLDSLVKQSYDMYIMNVTIPTGNHFDLDNISWSSDIYPILTTALVKTSVRVALVSPTLIV